jgi:glucose dehydrogenase
VIRSFIVVIRIEDVNLDSSAGRIIWKYNRRLKLFIQPSKKTCSSRATSPGEKSQPIEMPSHEGMINDGLLGT